MSYLLSDEDKSDFGKKVSSKKYFMKGEGVSSRLLSLFDGVRERRGSWCYF